MVWPSVLRHIIVSKSSLWDRLLVMVGLWTAFTIVRAEWKSYRDIHLTVDWIRVCRFRPVIATT